MRPYVDKQLLEQIRSLAEKIAKEMALTNIHITRLKLPGSLQSPEEQIKKIQFETERQLLSFVERIQHGIKVILHFQAVHAPFHPDIFLPDVCETLSHFPLLKMQQLALQSIYPQDPHTNVQLDLAISDAVLDACQFVASSLYNEKNYSEASFAFSIVTLLNATHFEGWMGLGNAEYYLKQYIGALIAYAMAVYSDPTSPYPHLYAAKCYEELKEYDNAINSLDLALLVAKNHNNLPQKIEEYKRTLRCKQ